MSSISIEIESIVREFTARVLAAAQAQANERAISAVSAALEGRAEAPSTQVAKTETILLGTGETQAQAQCEGLGCAQTPRAVSGTLARSRPRPEGSSEEDRPRARGG